MAKLPKKAIRLFMVSAAIKGVAQLVTRAFEGDSTASANDFKLLAVMDGRELDSKADSMRTGSATSVMGGIDIDLTHATLDPGGAHIALKAVMGGVRLIVPDHWRVDIDVDARGGSVDIKTADPADAEDGAPRLFVDAYARMGGVLIQPSEG
jgi:hypothetical protein